jgi:hypothetical protein
VNSQKLISTILHSLTPIRDENGQLPWLAAYCQYKILERCINIHCDENNCCNLAQLRAPVANSYSPPIFTPDA